MCASQEEGPERKQSGDTDRAMARKEALEASSTRDEKLQFNPLHLGTLN